MKFLNQKFQIPYIKLMILFYVFAIAFSASSGAVLVKMARVFLVLVAVMYAVINKKVTIRGEVYIVWFMSFWTICALSCFWAVNYTYARNMIFTLIYILITNLIINIMIKKREDYLFSIMKIAIVGAILHALMIYGNHGITAYLFTRGNGDLENANTLAFVCSFGMIFSFIIIKIKKNRMIFLYSILMCLNAFFAILTASKKVYIYIGVFFAVYFIVKSRTPIKMIRNFLICVFSALVLAFILIKVEVLYELVGNRIITMLSGLMGGETDGSTSFRLSLIQWGIEWFKAKPLFGNGIDCYKYLLGSNYSNLWTGSAGVYAHNNYIELLVDIGLIGTCIYYYLYMIIVIKSIRRMKDRDELARSSLAIIISLIITEFSQVSYFNPFLQLVLVLTWNMLRE